MHPEQSGVIRLPIWVVCLNTLVGSELEGGGDCMLEWLGWVRGVNWGEVLGMGMIYVMLCCLNVINGLGLVR